jgi:PleD family two-component response regulator
MLRASKKVDGSGTSTAEQLAANKPAPAVSEGSQSFASKESDFQINNALRSLLSALQTEKKSLDSEDENEKPRRVLLCLGSKRDVVAKSLADSGYKVYMAETPAQANERLREGKTNIVIFSPDFAPEYGGAAILQQKANAMYSSERRKLFLVSLEDTGTTMNAQEAFLRNLNLIVNARDTGQLPLILNRAVHDYNELYHYFNTALEGNPI